MRVVETHSSVYDQTTRDAAHETRDGGARQHSYRYPCARCRCVGGPMEGKRGGGGGV
jgi:hypothetical protein